MGKQALYRKYRSKTLDEVIGQEHITDTLKNALKKDAISHAYLFTGPKGVGKTSIARILAHEINKLEYTDEATHLDIIEIDAASNRRIDEIRELRDKVHIAPTSGAYKVYIIDEVHMLTREAFNALLKTLEEPPEHAVFILATTEAHKVPDTILSRTQRFTFKPVMGDKAVMHLRSVAKSEGININDDALTLLIEHGEGSFRDSISMLDQLSGLAKDSYGVEDVQLLLGVPQQEVIERIISSVAENNRAALFDSIRSLKEQGVDASRAAKAISRLLRECIVTDNPVLEHDVTLTVLKNLVAVTDTGSDFLDLELALLEVMKTPATKRTPVQTKEKKDTPTKPSLDSAIETNQKEDSAPRKKEATTTTEKKGSDKQSTYSSFSSDVWQEMLNDVKAKHNTLYGVLRMATPEQGKDELVLVFGFDFHKKQLESAKNRPVVREYLQKYVGNSEFSAVVKKAANKPVDKPAEKRVDKQKDEAIDNVSNIFGSAELLES